MLRWDEVHAYIRESEGDLLDELALCQNCLHKEPQSGGWTIAQISHHLVRTERIMHLGWTIMPKLHPRVLSGLDHFCGPVARAQR